MFPKHTYWDYYSTDILFFYFYSGLLIISVYILLCSSLHAQCSFFPAVSTSLTPNQCNPVHLVFWHYKPPPVIQSVPDFWMLLESILSSVLSFPACLIMSFSGTGFPCLALTGLTCKLFWFSGLWPCFWSLTNHLKSQPLWSAQRNMRPRFWPCFHSLTIDLGLIFESVCSFCQWQLL